ncbi:DUF3298 and DUF4163 domain-containing protein [Novisyntrophococcus fermenticellae]|uniref:DUF3298 and DUF4163 domain-containing protein n=1 Tax=Novisyntrophococcus fermenticellae TaxID=2068655 RepID=UPI001E4834BE|nr:DUF3298 and DUF4163 domain-containing protein [Novisyntrophococcus fermenticellae]
MQTIYNKTLEDTMYYRTIPVFVYKINYPFFTTTCNADAGRQISAYYAAEAKKTETHCREDLFPLAVDSAGYRPSNQPPFHSYTLDVVYKITYNSACITSLYMEEYTFMGGAHGATIRTSHTWDFISGKQFELKDFFPDNPSYQQSIFENINAEIAKRQAAESEFYFENYKELVGNTFNPKSFYLTPDGVVIYFQQYDIAPYANGIPEFLFPFKMKNALHST